MMNGEQIENTASRSVIRGALLAGSIIFGPAIGAFIGSTVADKPMKVPQALEAGAPEVCPAPSKESINRVEELFDAPKDRAAYADYMARRRRMARRISRLNKLSISTKPGQVHFIQQADQIIEPYGVNIDTYDKLEDIGATDSDLVPQLSPFQDNGTRRAVNNILDGVTSLPVSYVQLSGLKRVILYSNKFSSFGGFADYKAPFRTPGVENTYYYNTAISPYEEDGQHGAHEIKHLINDVECSPADSYNDPAFEALNPQDIYPKNPSNETAVNKAEQKYSAESSVDRLADLQGEQYVAAQNHDRTRFNRLGDRQRSILRRISVVNSYGLTNSEEDKAVLGSKLASPDYMAEVLDQSTPTIRKKFIFLMARLYEKSSSIVRQFAAIAVRPIPGDYYDAPMTYGAVRQEIKETEKILLQGRGGSPGNVSRERQGPSHSK